MLGERECKRNTLIKYYLAIQKPFVLTWMKLEENYAK